MSVEDLKERYENLQGKHGELKEEVRNDEAVLSVTKENIKKKSKELEEMGVKFETLKELKKKKKEFEERIEDKVQKLEEVLGDVEEYDSDDDDEDDEYEMEDIDF